MIVTVIIPCYNAESFIADTLNSVLNQTHSELEIICVDNGSTDQTVAILTNFKNKHANLKILFQPIKGAPAARNLGLQAASGKYIQFLDSDDLIVPDKIKKQLEFISQNNFDVLVSDRSFYNETMDELISTHTFKNIESNPLEIAISEIIITGNPLYLKSALINAGGWDETLKSAQDWELNIRMALQNFRFGYLPGIFLKSRIHKKSLSANWIEVTKNGVAVLEKFQKQIMPSLAFNSKKVQEKIFYCYFDLAIYTKEYDNYLGRMDTWGLTKNSTRFLTGFNKIFTKLAGLKSTAKLRSIQKSKQ